MFVSLKLAGKSHSLSSKVFSEIVHLTFWNVIFSIRSPSTLLSELEALLTLLFIFSPSDSSSKTIKNSFI